MLELFATRKPAQANQVTGHWRAVRICLDLATQEWLNVGVVLRTPGGETHHRLLTNFAGFRCIYDDDAADAARFLLDQAEFAIEAEKPFPTGWNVSFGPEKFVRGNTIDSILTGLFSRLVPLGRHQLDPTARIDREDHPHATQNVRVEVRKLLTKHLQIAKSAPPDFWYARPVPMHRDGAVIKMDVQIVANNSHGIVHGAIASAWYKTSYHRSASLNQAVNAVTTACEAFPGSHNVLYILRPPEKVSSLSDSDYEAIDLDIESSRWLLLKHGAELKIAREVPDIARTILKDLELIPDVR